MNLSDRLDRRKRDQARCLLAVVATGGVSLLCAVGFWIGRWTAFH